MHPLGTIFPLLLLSLAPCAAHAWQNAPVLQGSGVGSVHTGTGSRLRQLQHSRKPLHKSALDYLLGEYVERHSRCLVEQGQYVVITMSESYAGLGNRMLSVVTGMVLALMTDRCLFLHHDSYLRDFRNVAGLDMDWATLEAGLAARGQQASWYRLGPRSFWHMPDTDKLYATANFTELWANVTAVDITNDNDYLVPLLMSNVIYAPFFERYFPTREVFHDLAAFLFQLRQRHAAAAEAFRAARLDSAKFVIGLQIRTRKALGHLASVGTFATLARALVLKQGLQPSQVRIFVAADSSEALAAVRANLGADFVVVAVDAGAGRDEVATVAANPGTEDLALLDMKLLAGCDALVITSGSSFGYVAAAWGGVVPVHVLPRAEGKNSIMNPYFFRPLDSEPCYWGAHRYFLDKAPEEAAAAFLANPLWMQYAHCA